MNKIHEDYYYGSQNINSFWKWVTEVFCKDIVVDSSNLFISKKLWESLKTNSTKEDFDKLKPQKCELLVTVQVQYIEKRKKCVRQITS